MTKNKRQQFLYFLIGLFFFCLVVATNTTSFMWMSYHIWVGIAWLSGLSIVAQTIYFGVMLGLEYDAQVPYHEAYIAKVKAESLSSDYTQVFSDLDLLLKLNESGLSEHEVADLSLQVSKLRLDAEILRANVRGLDGNEMHLSPMKNTDVLKTIRAEYVNIQSQYALLRKDMGKVEEHIRQTHSTRKAVQEGVRRLPSGEMIPDPLAADPHAVALVGI